METQLLRDPQIFPTEDVLKNALEPDAYEVFASFMNVITSAEYGLTYEWRYYNDGKSWLCKILHKKKTVMWLSVWDGFFKISFFLLKSIWKESPLWISLKISRRIFVMQNLSAE